MACFAFILCPFSKNGYTTLSGILTSWAKTSYLLYLQIININMFVQILWINKCLIETEILSEIVYFSMLMVRFVSLSWSEFFKGFLICKCKVLIQDPLFLWETQCCLFLRVFYWLLNAKSQKMIRQLKRRPGKSTF